LQILELKTHYFSKKNISLIHHQKKLGGGFWKSFLLDLIIFL